MRQLELTCGRVALLDDEDYEAVAAVSWRSWAREGMRTRYAVRGQWVGGKVVGQRLHRVILGLTDPKVEVDHINGDGLDNRRANLRLSDRRGNNCNKVAYRNNKSGYKGVDFFPKGGLKPWRAQIQHLGKKTIIGQFETPEEAHAAYCEFAHRLHGEFARTK